MKLIFEALDDNKVAVREGMLGEVILLTIFGTLWFGMFHLIGKLFEKLVEKMNIPEPKTQEDAKKVKKDLSKEINVLKSIAKIIKSKPKVVYNGDYNLYEYIKMGIADTNSLKKYIAKFKDKIDKNSEYELKSILEDGEDEESHAELTKLKAKFIISDGAGNSQWITNSGDIYDWDHETHGLVKWGKYEDAIIKNIDYIYDCLRDDGLLVKE